MVVVVVLAMVVVVVAAAAHPPEGQRMFLVGQEIHDAIYIYIHLSMTITRAGEGGRERGIK